MLLVALRFIIDVFLGYVMTTLARSAVVFALENCINHIPRCMSGKLGPERFYNNGPPIDISLNASDNAELSS